MHAFPQESGCPDSRMLNEGDEIYIEPFRAKAFPIIKDLVVDRSSFDRIQQAGGFVSINTSGNPVDANTIPIPKIDADRAFDAATCIGCGGGGAGSVTQGAGGNSTGGTAAATGGNATTNSGSGGGGSSVSTSAGGNGSAGAVYIRFKS